MTYVMLIPDSTYVAARPKIKDHHLSLAYFGETESEGTTRLRRSVERWAYELGGPIPATANGIGMFNAGADGVAVVDLIDGIGTLKARMMVEATYGGPYGKRVGVEIGQAHGFTPHITREYLAPEDDFYAEICVDMIPKLDFSFVAIGVWTGTVSDTTKYEVNL